MSLIQNYKKLILQYRFKIEKNGIKKFDAKLRKLKYKFKNVNSKQIFYCNFLLQ